MLEARYIAEGWQPLASMPCGRPVEVLCADESVVGRAIGVFQFRAPPRVWRQQAGDLVEIRDAFAWREIGGDALRHIVEEAVAA